MTDRKPAGMPFESFIDQQIREAQERGEFDDLPGAGKPLPGAGRPHDDNWWLKNKMAEEGLTMPLPPALALRKESDEVLELALNAGSEGEVRQLIEGMNEKINAAIRRGVSGPPVDLFPFDVERVIERWRAARG
ncbi:DUF1992 domain-containing protein [Nonomuraea typhae]|uniref:DUF1992 domain-containing protein n=1 Tax=Nonomuraea typhae TaxID=2603600 RepID=A0ABW7YLE0_9ACTN